MIISPLGREHRSAVARLHMDNLRGRFKGAAGQHLLELYYCTVSTGPGATGFVALDGTEVVGYVCGVWDAAAVKRELVRRHWPQLLLWGGLQFITKPSVLRRVIPSCTSGCRPDRYAPKGYELRPIVVRVAARGTDVSTSLVEALAADAASRGFDSMFLLTEPDNAAANKFYPKAGFAASGDTTREGAQYLVYRRRLAVEY